MPRAYLLVGLFIGLLAAGGVGSAQALSVPEMVRLFDAGIGEAVILDQARTEGLDSRLTAEEILALKEAGASDDFLQALIREGAAAPETRGRVTGSRGEPAEVWTDDYAPPLNRVEIYYDPFGYYWYSWPRAYAYYDPFRWLDCGFYYAGWWDHRWWRYGPYCDHYRGLYGHGHAPQHTLGPSRDDRGRHSWTRSPRDDRSRTVRPGERGREWGRDRSRDRSPERSIRSGPEVRQGSPARTDRGSGRTSPDRGRSGNSTAPRSGWKR